MTREEAINHLKTVAKSAIDSGYDGAVVDAVDMAIKALEQEPCGKDINVPATDAISRQAVLEIVERVLSKGDAQFEIEQLPSVNSQPKIGHWEWVQYDYNPKLGNWHCSECRCVVVECVDKNEKGGIPLYKYCPQCGARVIEPQDSEGKE